MEKFVFTIISFVLVILVVVIISILSQVYDADHYYSGLDECISLKSDGINAIDIVFFSDDRKDAESYMNFFLGLEPFKEYKKRFNFYYIGYKPACEIFKGIALLCYTTELIKKAASCPNDYITVINNNYGSEIRSSSYTNVISINKKHPMSVLQHEFGHVFVSLAEEYLPAIIPRNSGGNCVSDCKDFNGKEDGCFDGCSREDYKRSVENGVMRTLSSTVYGSFNKWVITNKIQKYWGSGITGGVIDKFNCLDEKYYLIEGINIDGKIEIVGKSIEQGCIGDSGSGSFSYDLILNDGKRIEGGEFNPELIFSDIQGEEHIEGETYKSDRSFFLKVPVVENVKSLEIRNSDKELVAEADLEGIHEGSECSKDYPASEEGAPCRVL